MNWTSDTGITDFLLCFKETVVIWIPCAFLWIFSTLQIYNLKYSKYRDIPWNYYNGTKMIFITVTAILAAMNIILYVLFTTFEANIYLYSAIFDFSTSILFIILTYKCVKMGIPSSGVLLIFSFLNVLCRLPNIIIVINHWKSLFDMNETAIKNWSSIFGYLCNIIIFLLNCFADERPRHNLYFTESNEYHTNRIEISVLADIFLTYMDSYFWKYRKNPTNTILWQYHSREESYEDLLRKTKTYTKSVENSSKISILKLLHEKYRLIFWYVTFLNILNEAGSMGLYVCVHLLSSAIEFEEPTWKCYTYMILLCTILTSKLVVNSYDWKWGCKLEIEGKNTILMTLYEKALRISSKARTKYSTSDIVNLMSIDTNQLQSMPRNIYQLLGMLTFMLIAYAYLAFVLGVCTFISITVFLLLLITSYYALVHLKKLQRQAAQHKDHRNKFMQEIFSGIQVLKMYAWEPSFKNSAEKLREKEEKNLKKLELTYISLQVTLGFSPYLLFVSTYLSYFLMKPDRFAGISPIVISIVIFLNFRTYLNNLPTYWLSILQGFVAVRRIDEFLSAEELDPNTISHDVAIQPAILMKNVTFSWFNEKGPATLHNLDIQIEKGELVAVVGSVGAGKSSFISACLGEMYKTSGYANTRGSVAYVPQQAWILNTSFKTNIILDNEIQVHHYEKSLQVCALTHDLNNFAGGDSTEIGEKGINLSGGQKQRVSLARAIYQNADVYYLDDPLSALDSHVANHVYHQAIGSKSILKEKTRILVTHSVQFLPLVDKIILLKNGRISEIGTYCELLSKNGEFATFVRTNSSKETNERTPFVDRKIGYFQDEDEEIQRKENDDPHSKLMEEEIIQTEQVHKKLFYSYISTAGASLCVGFVISCIICQMILTIANAYISLWLSRENAWETKYSFLTTYICMGIAHTIVLQFSHICLFKAVTKNASTLFKTLLNNVLHWPMHSFDTIPIGRIISRFSDDVYVLDNVIGYVLNLAITLLFKNIALHIQYIYFLPETCFVLIPSVFVFYGIQVLFSPMFHQMKRLEAVHRSPLYSHLVESIAGLQSIRAYNFQNQFISRTKNRNNHHSSAYYSSSLCAQWMTNRSELVGVFVYTLITVIVIYKKNDAHISYLAGLLAAATAVLKLIGIAAMQHCILEDNILSIERIQQYIKESQEAWNDSTINTDDRWPLKGEIVFQDYKMQYRPGTKFVLKGISFRIQSGEKVGIVGRTGAGKSSIILGLFRIVEPYSGTISIDGLDITKLGLHMLRSRLTVIPQDPVLFSGTLRFNIDPFEKYSDSHLWNVLEKSHLKHYVSGLADGLNHKIEEGGKNLSFGQRQLVCLARALLRKTKILVLDEATASVDFKTDELIQKTIRDQFSNCTVITIAHRLNTLQHYDRILILDDGHVVKYDTVEKLVKSENLNLSVI